MRETRATRTGKAKGTKKKKKNKKNNNKAKGTKKPGYRKRILTRVASARRLKPATLAKGPDFRALGADAFATRLHDLGACDQAVDWCKGKSLVDAWATCPNGYWMQWWIQQGPFQAVPIVVSMMMTEALREAYRQNMIPGPNSAADKVLADELRKRLTPFGDLIPHVEPK